MKSKLLQAILKKTEQKSAQKLEHYSPREDLTEVNPEHFGEGHRGAEWKRSPTVKRSYFYFAGTEPENVIASGNKTKYQAVMPKEHKLYDIGQDPLSLKEKHKTAAGLVDQDAVEQAIAASGHHGYYNSKHPQHPNIVAYFHPLSVTKVEKSEALQKGVMQRKAPFNPKMDVKATDKQALYNWQKGGAREQREAIPEMTGNARIRAIHKLHGQTKARINPETGEREFLLHRGMGGKEHQENIRHGHAMHEEKTSWTPNYGTAEHFQRENLKNRLDRNAKIVSAWIPEKHIHSIPKQVGHTFAGGPNEFRAENEVIVKPGHASPVVDYKEPPSLVFPEDRLKHKKLGKSEDFPVYKTKKEHRKAAAHHEKEVDRIMAERDALRDAGKSAHHLMNEYSRNLQLMQHHNNMASSLKKDDEAHMERLQKPFKSEAQRRYFHWAAKHGKGNITPEMANEWESATGNKKLPERLKKWEAQERDDADGAAYKTALKTKGVQLKPSNDEEESLEKGARGDWKKEGYKLVHSIEKSPFNLHPIHVVVALSGNKDIIGKYHFAQQDGENGAVLEPIMSQTDPEHQRKGLASAAYDLVQKKTKLPVDPSTAQSSDAKKFWANRLGYEKPLKKSQGREFPVWQVEQKKQEFERLVKSSIKQNLSDANHAAAASASSDLPHSSVSRKDVTRIKTPNPPKDVPESGKTKKSGPKALDLDQPHNINYGKMFHRVYSIGDDVYRHELVPAAKGKYHKPEDRYPTVDVRHKYGNKPEIINIKSPRANVHELNTLKTLATEYHEKARHAPSEVNAEHHAVEGWEQHHPELIHGLQLENTQPVNEGRTGARVYNNKRGKPVAMVKPSFGENEFNAEFATDIGRLENHAHFAHPKMETAHREALYETAADQVFGLGHYVPKTSLFVDPRTGKKNSAMEFIPNASHWNPKQKGPGYDEKSNTLRELNESGDAQKLAAMNVILGNNDRHRKNYMFDKNHKLKLIDHGFTFDYGNFFGTPVPDYLHAKEPMKEDVRRWIEALDPEKLTKVLASKGAPESVIQSAVGRMEALKDFGRKTAGHNISMEDAILHTRDVGAGKQHRAKGTEDEINTKPVEGNEEKTSPAGSITEKGVLT